MPSFIFKQQALKAGKSEFSQHTAREVTAAACEHESKHKLYSTSSPSNSHPYLTTKGMWHTQREAEALGLQRCSFMLLSRARQTSPRHSGLLVPQCLELPLAQQAQG